MKKIEAILKSTEFESSSTETKQFNEFFKLFKKEFETELSSIGASNFTFHKGHFYISGFFDLGTKLYYFSLSDVRDCHFRDKTSLLYRTAQHRKDFSGGINQYVNIEQGMADRMHL